MFFGFGKPMALPQPNEALPGREAAIAVVERHLVTGQSMVGPWPGMEVAYFAMGCFWGAERKFWQTEGVVSTAVGYQGGFTPNPLYKEVCSGMTGHTEVVLVVFDPTVTSYEALLQVFWENHDPTQGMRQGNDRGTQYRSAIYTTSDSQLEAARSSRGAPRRRTRRSARRLTTVRDGDARAGCFTRISRRWSGNPSSSSLRTISPSRGRSCRWIST